MPLRDRAHVVCTECHARKVKCDLQTASDKVCNNCRRSQQICIEREGTRKRRPSARHRDAARRSQPCESTSLELPSQDIALPQPAVASPEIPPTVPKPRANGFISHCSLAHFGEQAESVAFASNSHVVSSYLPDSLLAYVQAEDAPRPALFRAWADAYTTQAFHHCPVLEQKDLLDSSASLTLQKSICMVGNLMRHDPSGPSLAAELYGKVKMLIYMNYDQEPVQLLKSLCLISMWNKKPSNPINLDGPWHWIGVATRLAMQMGVQRESTIRSRPDAGCLRRLFWQLHNSDALEVACWGRPSLLRRYDFDIKLPTLADFEIQNTQSLFFIESTKLCTIIARMSELQAERRPVRAEELTDIKVALCDWVNHLPDELQLFDAAGSRNAYYRPASELSIQYFVAVILSEFLTYKNNPRPCRVLVPSLLAASCGASLYDEIHCRDEAVYLPPIHGFFCLAFALPLIHYVPQSPVKEATCKRDLGVIRSILTGMRDRYGDWKMAHRMMDELEKHLARDGRPWEGVDNTQIPEMCCEAHRLFPFPPTFCENMDLLKLATAPEDEFLAANFVQVQNWPSDDAIFDCTWMDLFGVDFGNPGVEFDTSS